MRTAENQCIHIFIFQFLQISVCNFYGHRIMQPAFLYQRYKQWAGLTDHRNFRIQFLQISFVNSTANCADRTDHTNSFIDRLFCSNLCSCSNHTKNRYILFMLYRIKRKCTCCVTGDHNCFHLLFFQKMNDLSGVANNRISGFTAVWNSGCITKINNLFRRKITHDLTCHCQATYSGIKHTDRCISIYLHM